MFRTAPVARATTAPAADVRDAGVDGAPPADESGKEPATAPGDRPGTPARNSAARLALVIGSRRLLIDLSEAGEIVPMPPVIVPVPLTRDWFVGVTNLRGSLFTVIDLRRFSGEGFTDVTKETRLLSLAPTMNFNATVIVSRMLGLRNTASMAALPDEGTVQASGNAGAWLGQRFADAEGQVWQELSLSKLVATPEFLMVGR